MGTFTAPPTKRGQKCVVKESKDSYTWKQTDWDVSVKIQEESKKLAEEFNKESNCNRSIKFTDVVVHKVISQGDTVNPKLGEYVLVEDYIPGDFTKWCNNNGYISSASELMPAFMHWSWVHSKGQVMIADLQGVLSGDTYRLTDPVLLSNTEGGKYGCTDTGVEGMAMFFLRHTCNQFCRYSGVYGNLPTIADVVGYGSANTMKLESIIPSTAYAHELKLPAHIRKTMITVFPQVATRYAY